MFKYRDKQQELEGIFCETH